MRVIFADWLKQNFLSFDEELRTAVVDFAVYMEENDIKGLKGRNKSSVLPNPTTKKEHKHAKFAQKYCLWHYLRAEKAKQRFARSQDKGYARSGHTVLYRASQW